KSKSSPDARTNATHGTLLGVSLLAQSSVEPSALGVGTIAFSGPGGATRGDSPWRPRDGAGRRPRRYVRHGCRETIHLVMLGWLISVSRCGSRALREARGDADAMRSILIETTGSADVPKSTDADQRLATWQTGLGGLDWLDPLVSSGRAVATSRG